MNSCKDAWLVGILVHGGNLHATYILNMILIVTYTIKLVVVKDELCQTVAFDVNEIKKLLNISKLDIVIVPCTD